MDNINISSENLAVTTEKTDAELTANAVKSEKDDTAQIPSDGQKEPMYKVFKSQAEWQKEIDSIIGARLKNYRELKNELEAVKSGKQEEQKPKIEAKPNFEEIENAFGVTDTEGLKNDAKFNEALQMGLSSVDAYRLCRFDDIVAAKSAAAKQNLLDAIRSKSIRISELGVQNGCTPIIHSDVSHMSYDDIKSVRHRVYKGEKVTL